MNFEEIVARLADASDQELGEALAAIGTEAGKVSEAVTTENVEALERYAAAREAIVTEQNSRSELAARGDAARAAFATATEDATEAAEDAATTSEDAATEAEVEEAEGESADGGEAVTASAKLGSIGKARGKANASARAGALTVTAVTRSVGATASFNSGTQFTADSLVDALAEKHGTIHRSGVVGRQTVARVEFSYPESRRLDKNVSANVNTKRIQDATSTEAITAAGGLCAPLETLYDISVLGVTSRPVRDALSRFQVDRGGIQYRMPMDALAMTEGLGVWTVEMDEAVGVVETPTDVPDPAKTCAIIECPGVVDAVVEAIYLCLQYPNFSARFDREWVDATTRAALIAHARFSENRLLAKLFAGSKLLYDTKHVSAVRDVLVAIDKTVAYYRNRHRLDTMVPLHMILPRWVLDLFRADLTRGLGSTHLMEFLGVADSTIMGWFRNRGVNVTFHLDGLAAQDNPPTGAGPGDSPQQFYNNAAAGTQIPGFIDRIDALLYAEGDWLFLDGGTLDLGLVRDSALNRINRYQTFVEAWEGVAFNGIESLRLVLEVQPTGSATGTIDGSALVD